MSNGPFQPDAPAVRNYLAAKIADAYFDLLQRHLLCAATGLHDPRPDGTCADCEAVVGDAPVCADDVLIHAQPDQDTDR